MSLATHFQRGYEDCVIVVWRRYSHISKVYESLRSSAFPRYAAMMKNCPEFPPKVRFRRFDSEVVEARRKAFQAIFEFIGFNQPLLESPELLAFLTDNDVPPAKVVSPRIGEGRYGKVDAQEDSIRAFVLGRYYDQFDLGSLKETVQGMTVSLLLLTTVDIASVLAVATQMAAAGMQVRVISMDHHKSLVEAHKLEFHSISGGDAYISLSDLRTSVSGSAKDVKPSVEISTSHVSVPPPFAQMWFLSLTLVTCAIA